MENVWPCRFFSGKKSEIMTISTGILTQKIPILWDVFPLVLLFMPMNRNRRVCGKGPECGCGFLLLCCPLRCVSRWRSDVVFTAVANSCSGTQAADWCICCCCCCCRCRLARLTSTMTLTELRRRIYVQQLMRWDEIGIRNATLAYVILPTSRLIANRTDGHLHSTVASALSTSSFQPVHIGATTSSRPALLVNLLPSAAALDSCCHWKDTNEFWTRSGPTIGLI